MQGNAILPFRPPEPGSELLDRYLAGECSAEEAAQIRAWAGTSPLGRSYADEVREAYRTLGAEAVDVEGMQRVLGRVAGVVGEPRSRDIRTGRGVVGHALGRGGRLGRWTLLWRPSHSVGHVGARATARLSWVGMAVAVLCLIGLTGTLMFRSGSEVPTTHYQTATGQVSRVVLPGGTVMTLAPATSAAVSRTAVDVVGEAYFSVAPSSAHPFAVRTSNTVVQVLGTAFSVRRYANEIRTQVIVEEGKVAVRAKRNGIVSEVPTAISTRMMALVTDSGVTVSSGIATREYTSWRQGVRVFNGVPLRDVVTELGRIYGVDVRVADSALARIPIIAEVDAAHKPLTTVLDALSMMLDAHYIRDGRDFVLLNGSNGPGVLKERLPHNHYPQLEKQYGR